MGQSKYRMRAGATLILEVFSRADLTMTIQHIIVTGKHIVTGKQIGRASCRERVSSPV